MKTTMTKTAVVELTVRERGIMTDFIDMASGAAITPADEAAFDSMWKAAKAGTMTFTGPAYITMIAEIAGDMTGPAEDDADHDPEMLATYRALAAELKTLAASLA